MDLDTVAEMALPTLPDWEWAHAIHADLVGAWTARPLDVVVDEGSSSSAEVAQILAVVPDGVDVLRIVLLADVERSWERAQGDHSRGISKDHDFLGRVYEEYTHELPALGHDLLLDVEATTLDERADAVVIAIRHRLTRS